MTGARDLLLLFASEGNWRFEDDDDNNNSLSNSLFFMFWSTLCLEPVISKALSVTPTLTLLVLLLLFTAIGELWIDFHVGF